MEYIKQLTSFFELRLFLFVFFLLISLAFFFITYKKRTKKFIIVSVIILLLLIWNIIKIIASTGSVPKILFSSPGNNNVILAHSPDIKVTFSSPVVYDKLTIHTNPELETTIKKDGYFWNLLPFGTALTIVPKNTLPPGERIMVYFVNIKGILTKGNGGEKLIEMKVDDPVMVKTLPSDNSENLSTTQEFLISFSSEILDLREWSIRSEPNHSLTLGQTHSQTLSIKPNEPFRQGTKYKMIIVHTPTIVSRSDKNIIRQLDPITKGEINISTVKPAYIAEFAPSGDSINPKDPLNITFDEPMEIGAFSQFFRIDPTIATEVSWNKEENKLSISHPEFKKDTKYTVTFAKGLRTAKGGLLESDVSFSFKTAGPLMITDSEPKAGSKNVPVDSAVKLIFDQHVPESIKDQISITPDMEGSFSIKENLVEFRPKNNLKHEAQYTVRIAINAPSVYGLPANSEKTISFSTQPDQVLLKVPYFRQETFFTCNVAAARMLLAYRGTSVGELELVNKIGHQGVKGSGNPHKGYVSNFGTFWEAVANGVRKYRGVRVITSGNLNEILNEVKKGKPVMTWGQNGWSNPYDISWTANDGTYVKAVNGMHSVVVTGYTGSTENPKQIFVNDPWRGQYSMSKDLFLQRWSYYKMAMVVE